MFIIVFVDFDKIVTICFNIICEPSSFLTCNERKKLCPAYCFSVVTLEYSFFISFVIVCLRLVRLVTATTVKLSDSELDTFQNINRCKRGRTRGNMGFNLGPHYRKSTVSPPFCYGITRLSTAVYSMCI
jgi:hypothetical protein